MEQNPYEAPQTVTLIDSAHDDPARRLADVRHGVQLNFYALLVGIGVLLTATFVQLTGSFELWSLLSWPFTIASSVAILMQALGLWILRKAPPESRIYLLVMISFGCSILSLFIYWSSIGLSYLFGDYRWYFGGYCCCFAAQCLSVFLFYWSLLRLGRYTRVWRLHDIALATLIYFVVLNGYDLFELMSVTWSSNNDQVATYLVEKQDFLGHPWHLGARLLGYLLGGLTMRAVNRISTFTDPVEHDKATRDS